MLLLGLLPKKQNSTSFILEAKSIQLEESTNCKHVKLLKTKKRNGNYFDRCPFQSLRDKNLQNTSTLSIALMADVGQLRTEGFNRVKTAAVNKLSKQCACCPNKLEQSTINDQTPAPLCCGQNGFA